MLIIWVIAIVILKKNYHNHHHYKINDGSFKSDDVNTKKKTLINMTNTRGVSAGGGNGSVSGGVSDGDGGGNTHTNKSSWYFIKSSVFPLFVTNFLSCLQECGVLFSWWWW